MDSQPWIVNVVFNRLTVFRDMGISEKWKTKRLFNQKLLQITNNLALFNKKKVEIQNFVILLLKVGNTLTLIGTETRDNLAYRG